MCWQSLTFFFSASKEELEFAKLKKDYQLLCLSDDEPDSICPNVLKILQDFDHKIHKDQIREITDASLSDAWLAELSAITARAIRHLLVPGTALFGKKERIKKKKC